MEEKCCSIGYRVKEGLLGRGLEECEFRSLGKLSLGVLWNEVYSLTSGANLPTKVVRLGALPEWDGIEGIYALTLYSFINCSGNPWAVTCLTHGHPKISAGSGINC